MLNQITIKNYKAFQGEETLGLRKMVSDPSMDFSPQDVIIYFVDNDGEGAYLSPIITIINFY